jgi:hypothetical protein
MVSSFNPLQIYDYGGKYTSLFSINHTFLQFFSSLSTLIILIFVPKQVKRS